ncbi:MAG TPA: hypothetical protein VM369_11365 [Candidatus Binatia bacterium]|nr:hypothetical protein [Candidatus Binatia bacterium]
MIVQLVSMAGATLILVAFTLQQIGRWSPDDPSYLWCNLAGSSVLTVVAVVENQWGFILLEVAWAAVSARSLLRLRR